MRNRQATGYIRDTKASDTKAHKIDTLSASVRGTLRGARGAFVSTFSLKTERSVASFR